MLLDLPFEFALTQHPHHVLTFLRKEAFLEKVFFSDLPQRELQKEAVFAGAPL